MGINLKGFATGFAKTLATRIEDERDKEEKILSNRFNLAASNRLTRQKEAAELRKVYETRVKNFNSAYPMATEQQIAAAISTETNYDTLMKAHEEGFSDDEKANVLSNYVKVGEMPEKFTTAMDLVEQRVQPQVGEVKQAKGQTNKLLGFIDVSPGERKRQMYAEQYGVGADELDAYAEGAAPVSDLGSMGSVSSGFLKKPKSPEDRLKNLRLALMDAETEDEKITVQEEIDKTIGAMNYGTNPKTLQEEVNRVSLMLEDETDPTKIEAMKKKLASLNTRIKSNTEAQAQEKDRAAEKGMKPLTYSEITRAVEKAQVIALEKTLGLDAIKKNKLLQEYKDEVTGETRTRMRRVTAEDLPEIQSLQRKAILDYLKINGYIKPDGTLLDHARAILSMYQFIDPETGKLTEDPINKNNRQDTENEANRQRKNEAPPTTEQGQKTATMDQVRAIAKNRNKTAEEIRADMIANGYVITGE